MILNKKKWVTAVILGLCIVFMGAINTTKSAHIKLAKLKYSGGGDWYANRTALPNLAQFCNINLGTAFPKSEAIVEPGSPDIFNFPYVYMTGHGNFVLSTNEAANMRKYLTSGGFLHIDDNYGLDPFIRPQLKKIFPELDLIELPYNHPIFNQKFSFPKGLPKVHEHDGNAPQAFGLLYNGRLVCLYTHESDLGNGWEDQAVYGNPESIRTQALQMGANIIQFVFTQNL